MSQQVSQDKKVSAKQLFDKGETIAAIAQQLEVSRRTIERWADAGAWREQRDVIPIGQARKSKAVVNSSATPHQNPPSVRRQRRGDPIDELLIVEEAIASLALLISGMSSAGEDIPIDTRGIGGTAGALVRLLEYRRKIAPPTAAALAEQAIAMGIAPHEFVAELKAKWQQRA